MAKPRRERRRRPLRGAARARAAEPQTTASVAEPVDWPTARDLIHDLTAAWVAQDLDAMVRQGWPVGDALDAIREHLAYETSHAVVDGVVRWLTGRWSP